MDDPLARAPLDVAGAVRSLWTRVMPNSTCWNIKIDCRFVLFDACTGAVAGCCYACLSNKYIACVGVDGAFRRRGLGTAMLVGTVGLMQAEHLTAWTFPNLCVSPKDLKKHAHLHRFYRQLGFEGGREGIGGNYTLPPDRAAALLLRHGMRLVASASGSTTGVLLDAGGVFDELGNGIPQTPKGQAPA